MPSATTLGAAALRSLRESGLRDETIIAAQIVDDPEVVGGANKYKIPYFSFDGKPLDHFRVRNLGSANGAKYVQPKNTPSRLYIPPTLHESHGEWWLDTSQALIITEGEKKALAAAQEGLLCVGLGGVDSWRSRTVLIPASSVSRIDQGPKRTRIVAKLEDQDVRILQEVVSPELLEIDWRGRYVIVIYDSPDVLQNEQVQNAAFNLGIWLEAHGASVGQFILPEHPTEPDKKVGLDDYLMQSDEHVADLLTYPAFPFPQPGNAREWITRTLNERQSRESQERISRAVIAILDNRGDRYKDTTASGDSYYFDASSKALYAFSWDDRSLRNSPFWGLLADMGVRTADSQVVSRIADRFVHDDPIHNVTPRRVLAHQGDAVYYQLNDGEIVRVDADGVSLGDNGIDDMLFVAGSVTGLDSSYLDLCLRKQLKEPIGRWYTAISSVRLVPIAPLTLEESRILLTCLFHMSPWLNRWRGLMLPLELAIAEPNSGKSFLYNLRKEVLTGDPSLYGLPHDFKDWVSQIAAAPAMWICDNLGNVQRELFHKLNDELARLTTDPHPTINLRELYTTKDVRSIPIHTVFAITGIKNPFTAPDITQRSIVYRLQAIPPGERNSNWYREQLKDGREPWIAEHLLALQGFFQGVRENWDPNYKSGYRLAHFEQALLRMGESIGWHEEIKSVVAKLPMMVSEQVASSDPVVEGLETFIREWMGTRRVTLSDVCAWVKYDDDQRFSAIRVFNNPQLLGRYLRDFRSQLEQSLGVGIEDAHNQTYIILPTPTKADPTTPTPAEARTSGG